MSRAESQDFARRFVIETGPAAKVAEIAEPLLDSLGFRLVRVLIVGTGGGATVQVMAERPDGRLTVDECATISRGLSPLLDAYDPIAGEYRLEISSPGIDRPLVRPEDFVRWAGHVAKVELKVPVDGRRKLKGIVEGFEDGEARLEVEIEGEAEPQVVGLAPELIASARLVLTDDLIAETLKQSSKGAEAPSTETDIENTEDVHGPGRYQRKPAGAAANRGRGGAREIDRQADRHRRDGGRHPKGG